jgi:hypothetical protein
MFLDSFLKNFFKSPEPSKIIPETRHFELSETRKKILYFVVT